MQDQITEDLITIELPKTASKEDLKAIRSELEDMAEIEDIGSLTDRSIDPSTLGLWIQVATGIVGVASSTMPLIQKLMEIVRGKAIKGAKITLANGTVVSIDEASVKDVEKLILAANQPAKPKAGSKKKQTPGKKPVKR